MHQHKRTKQETETKEKEEETVSSYLRGDLSSLENYKPVKPLDVIAAEIGLPISQLVKLDANENVYGPIPRLRNAIATADLHIYPDPNQTYFRAAVAHYIGFGINAENIVGGSGADDIIDILIRLVDPVKIITASPTFGMYSFLGKIMRSPIIDIPRLLPDFTLNFDALMKEIKSTNNGNGNDQNHHGPPLVFLASPNNPTGDLITEAQARALCSQHCVVIIDEAYAEFCSQTLVPLITEYPNLIILRTFSKWAGLAGLRVGYSISNITIAHHMMAIKQPYNINIAGDLAAREAILAKDEIFVTVDALKNELASITERVKGIKGKWMNPIPSHANFVLVRVTGYNPAEIVAFLRKRGILLRYYSTKHLANYFRISAGRQSDTDALMTQLENFANTTNERIRSVDAILFDMDGVLADVSNSYRQCILKTCAWFGATITSEDIVVAKNKGGFNNDWKLSLHLINQSNSKSTPTLAEVTEKFEELYNGKEGVDGLWKTEKCLLNSSLLIEIKRLNPNCKFAIVTGRPRYQAIRFLETYNLQSFFQALVCMEDGPAKPDPFPVSEAMRLLGVKRALMIGDTVDDIRSSIASSKSDIDVVPVGVPAPGHSNDISPLLLSGASLMLSTLDDLIKYMS